MKPHYSGLLRPNKQSMLYLRTAICIAVLYRIGSFQYDNSIFKHIVQASCLLAFFLICRSFFKEGAHGFKLLDRWRQAPPAAFPLSRHAEKLWCGLGLAIAIAMLGTLEWSQPYYFTKDDTHSASFPIILQALRGVFHDGVFPTWNPYQFLGMPTATLGYFSLTDPILYLSYLLSLGLFGHELATMDLWAWIYLLGGYVIGYGMFRALRIRPALAIAASLSCALCNFNVVFGAHNNLFIPQALWLPALGWSLVRFMQDTITLRWVVYSALSIGLFFHAGNIQMWFYGVGLWGLGIVWIALWKPGSWWRRLMLPIASGLGGLALAAPLLIAEAIEVTEIYRGSAAGPRFNFHDFLLPSLSLPDIDLRTFYSGSVFIFAFFVKAALDIARIGSKDFKKRRGDTSCFTFLAIIAFVMVLGSQTPVWNWLAHYPPFSRIKTAQKFNPYVVFFMTVSGAILIESATAKFRYGNTIACGLAVAAVALVAHADYMNLGYPVRWRDTPYPPAWPEEAVLQTDGFSTKGRVLPYWALWPGTNRGYPQTLACHYATIYHIPAVFGWFAGDSIESMLPEENRLYHEWPNRLHFMQEYGIQWAVLSRIPGQNYQGITPAEADNIKKMASDKVIPERNSQPQKQPEYVIEMYHIGNASTKPMAYAQNAPSVPLYYKLLANGMDIQLPAIGNATHIAVVANFFYRHWFKAYTDSESDLTVTPDDMDRILVSISKPAHILSIRYSPPWQYGLLLDIIFLLLAWRIAPSLRNWNQGNSPPLSQTPIPNGSGDVI